MSAWIDNLFSADNDVWGFVVFLVTGHLVGKPRERDAVPLLIPHRSDCLRLRI
ncbi:MAG: hypothetical protein ACTHKS_02085 [Gaiellaceae bacterium]